MTKVDVVYLPSELESHQVRDRAVVAFDVLRATTTIVTALAAGANEVRIFASLDAASVAASTYGSPRLLCGERKCLAPPGFDLGNSPREFTSDRVSGKTIFLSTTNGTRAIVAARDAPRLFAAALVNALATAQMLVSLGLDVTLLCAGTDSQVAPEDIIGAGAVIDRLFQRTQLELGCHAGDALRLFKDSQSNLVEVLRKTQGGRNIIAAGLYQDIESAARLDALSIAVEVTGQPPVARRIAG